MKMTVTAQKGQCEQHRNGEFGPLQGERRDKKGKWNGMSENTDFPMEYGNVMADPEKKIEILI